MNEKIIETQIPFEDELLEEYLNNEDNESMYVINFSKSKYKDARFLNYIYNLDMKNFIVNFETLDDDLANILVEYIKSNKILSVDIFNRIWINVIEKYLFSKEFDNSDYNLFIDNFIKNNRLIINELTIILCSLKTFLLDTVLDENFNIDKYLKDSETFNNIGINLVSLRKAPDFWNLFSELDNAKNITIKKYRNFYNNSFEGYNVDKFFLKEFNPLGLIFTMSIDDYTNLGNFVKELKCMSISD